MNIQRLKFAWARGARIEFFVPNSSWQVIDPNWTDKPERYRIHPYDEHLQYGPVAQAFRDMALYIDIAELPELVEMFMDLAGSTYVLPFAPGDNWGSNVELDFCRLFFAEYLADEGL